MNKIKFMKTIAVIITCIMFSHTIHAQDESILKIGPQGGSMKTVQNYNIELVNSISRMYVYLYDKSLTPVSNDGVLSEIMFCYEYDECLNKSLTILGKNGYTVNVVNSHFYYCEVTLIINGNPIKAKFNNTSGLTENK